MTTYYWFKTCPFCDGQGRLIITEDVTHKRLYLHCEECEYGWMNPEDAENVKKRFLTLDEDFESENPSLERIKEYGWLKYALHSFED